MNKKPDVLDERQKQIREKAGMITGIFVICCVIAAMVYKICTQDEIGWEFWTVTGALILYGILCNVLGDIEAPKSITNALLPTGNTKKEKLIRIKDYVFRSAIFATACAVMDVILISSGKEDVTDYEMAKYLFPSLSGTEIIVITAIIAFVGMFIISFTFDYLIGERRVKKYNQMISEFEED